MNHKRLLMARQIVGLSIAELCQPVGFDEGAYVLLEQGKLDMQQLPQNFADVLERLTFPPAFYEQEDPPEIGASSMDIHYPGWREESARALKREYAGAWSRRDKKRGQARML